MVSKVKEKSFVRKIISVTLWIFSIFFILGGFTEFSNSVLSGVLIVLAGLIIMPPLTNLIKKKSDNKIKTWIIVVGFFILLIIGMGSSPTSKDINSETTEDNIIKLTAPKEENSSDTTQQDLIKETKNKPSSEEQIEISIDELESIFGYYSDLTEIQKEEKYETEYEDKLIKTSIVVDKIGEASLFFLTGDYVVREMYGAPSYSEYSSRVAAFFSSSEKDKLLNANIGDTIIFTGKLSGYNSRLEFTDSKVLEIK